MKRQSAQEIEAEAFQWVMALDRKDDPRAQRRLEAWLHGDTRRQGAFLKAQAMWAAMDEAAKNQPLRAESGPAARPVRRLDRRRWLAGGMAAGLVAALGLGLRPETYRTARGEQRTMPLDDGSAIRINTESALSVAMTKAQRRIRLRDGEAWFRVAHDKTRPFLVEAGRVAVQATGTAFAVRREAAGVDVLVTEGTVDVWNLDAPGRKVSLKAGQSLFVPKALDLPTAEKVQDDAGAVSRKLAWREGHIELDGETLATAVSEFNRYNRVQLQVTDPALAQERLFGVFRVDDPDGFVQAVQVSLHASIQHPARDQIALTRLGGAPSKKNS
ncbi:FecR family protein [Caulobacter sp.]|uniref:FecR family protein n=1 Tax=Caulobacter sp. TaxID=78 RepID=UPI003BAEDD1D